MTLIELDNRILQIIFELSIANDDIAKDTLLDELAILNALADTEETIMH